MRRFGIAVLTFFALGFAVHSVMSVVERHDTLSSVHMDDRSALNHGVLRNGALTLFFSAGAVALVRVGRKRRA